MVKQFNIGTREGHSSGGVWRLNEL